MPDQNRTTIAGYRLVRTLGAGRRATVHLGYAGGPDGAGRSVALKVFPRETAASADPDVGVLAAVRAPGLPVLFDVASVAGGGVCLVLERLEGPSLPQWLAGRHRAAPGELVTVVAPLVATLSLLHAARWSLGGLAPTAVRFSASGRPVITSLAAAAPLDATDDDPRAPAEAVRADYRALAAFIEDLFALADVVDPGFAALLRASSSAPTLASPLAELEGRLFAWHPAGAVVFPAAPDDDVPHPFSPRVPRRPIVVPPSERETVAVPAPEPTSGAWARLSARMEAPWRRLPTDRLRAVLRDRRRPVIVAGVVAILLAAVALTLVPQQGAKHAMSAGPGSMPSTTAEQRGPASPAPAEPTEPQPAEARPTADPAPAADTEPAAPDAPAISGDDPVSAAGALLAERLRCLERASAACLAEVAQAGSPVLEADQHAVASRSTARLMPSAGTITLVERVGDAAIVQVSPDTGAETPPASLLLMKGEAGWRLREVFDG